MFAGIILVDNSVSLILTDTGKDDLYVKDILYIVFFFRNVPPVGAICEKRLLPDGAHWCFKYVPVNPSDPVGQVVVPPPSLLTDCVIQF